MSEKCQRRGRSQQRLDGIAQSHYVFIFVDRRTVHKLDAWQLAGLHRAMGQTPEPFQVFWSELVARPQRRQSGDGIKVLQVDRAAGRLSWLPRTKMWPRARERSITSFGLAP